MWMKRSEGEVGWRREAGNGKRGAVGWHFKMTGVGLQPPLIASKGLKVGSRGVTHASMNRRPRERVLVAPVAASDGERGYVLFPDNRGRSDHS